MAALPIPSAGQLTHSQQLRDLVRHKIAESGGWISFAEFMHMALYTPKLGYYSGGEHKFGQGGDFVTAPEISSLFAQTMARQAASVLACRQGDMLELGAGTGKLATDLLLELQTLGELPKHYYILEVSDYLRQIQRENLQSKLPQDLFARVIWLDGLPQDFTGLILANEVLDALPVHILHKTVEGWHERGVAFEDEFVWKDTLEPASVLAFGLPDDLPEEYVTEVCPAASALVRQLVDTLQSGAIVLIDYGFSASEYYHPQRTQGTLMCHFQHYAHDNPLIHIGLQDITAHVNFTQIAEAAHGASLAGYTTQAQFLINCGILDILAQHSPDSPQFMQLAAAAQKYLSPAEMGELFKVIAFVKNMDEPLVGFAQGDKSHTL